MFVPTSTKFFDSITLVPMRKLVHALFFISFAFSSQAQIVDFSNASIYVTKELKCKFNNNIYGNMTHVIVVDENTNKLTINNNITDYLPYITISTNTDLGKNLTSDSYIALTFDNSLGNPNCSQNGGYFYKYKYCKYSEKIAFKKII